MLHVALAKDVLLRQGLLAAISLPRRVRVMLGHASRAAWRQASILIFIFYSDFLSLRQALQRNASALHAWLDKNRFKFAAYLAPALDLLAMQFENLLHPPPLKLLPCKVPSSSLPVRPTWTSPSCNGALRTISPSLWATAAAGMAVSSRSGI